MPDSELKASVCVRAFTAMKWSGNANRELSRHGPTFRMSRSPMITSMKSTHGSVPFKHSVVKLYI